MDQPQLQEIRLKNFRCFRDVQTARLAPLTLLVGDNSTGKTSFLAAVRAVWEIGHQHSDPDFRQPPYDLGSFWDIAHNPGDQDEAAVSFQIGFTTSGFRNNPFRFDAIFKPVAVDPTPVLLYWCRGDVWIRCDLTGNDEFYIDFGDSNRSWRVSDEKTGLYDTYRRQFLHLEIERLFDMRLENSVVTNLEGTRGPPEEQYTRRLDSLLEDIILRHRTPPFASAPIRSHPLRTYDHIRQSPDPEGAYVPSYFASVQIHDQREWLELKSKLEEFGRTSGLFDEILLNQLGTSAAGPFQIEIRRESGPKRNLIDVGYGVSQVLPVVAELSRPEAPFLFLLQQPEVHLHPSAQAALGTLFCATVASGRQLVIETHSEYILDRVRMDIRDGETKLKADDVSVLYFERSGNDVRIHSLRFDEQGNILDAPDGYGRFFMNEMRRSIGL